MVVLRIIPSMAALLLAVSVTFADPPTSDKGRTDFHGDPLPSGARARLGTTRFRGGGLVFACVFAPDGKTIAASSDDPTIRLFDADSGRPQRKLTGHKNEVASLAYSPDGRWLASGSLDGTICLHDPATGKMIRNFAHKEDRIWSLAFAPDKTLIAGGGSTDWQSKDYPVRIWDAVNGKEVRALAGHTAPIAAVAVSPDGKLLASAGKHYGFQSPDGAVRLWDATTGKLLFTLKDRKQAIYCLAFSPDGKRLVSGGVYTLSFWDVAAKKLVHSIPIDGAGMQAAAFSPDGNLLATGSRHYALYLWDPATGRKLHEFGRRSGGYQRNSHPGGISCVTFSPDGRTLVYGVDNILKVFDVRARKVKGPSAEHADKVARVQFADRHTLLSLGDDGRLLRWDLRTGEAESMLPGGERFIHAGDAALSPDQKVFASWDGPIIRLVDTVTGKALRSIPLFEKKPDGWTSGVVAFSPDGKLLAGTIPDRNLVCVWDAANGKEVARLEQYPEQSPPSLVGHSPRLRWSPDGRTLASSAGDQRSIWLHDARTGKFLREMRRRESREKICSLAFSSDGRTIAAGYDNGNIRVWESRTGGERIHFTGHRKTPPALVFAPKGRWLASTSWDGTVRLWDVLTGKEMHCWRGHDGHASSVAFSPDGRLLATGGEDTTVLLWDIDDALSRHELKKPELPASERESLWSELTQEDAARAYRAMSRLMQAFPDFVPFIHDHLKPVRRADDQALARLIGDLDSDVFKVREEAEAELLKIGEPIEAALRRALTERPSLEKRRRIERLRERLRGRLLRAARAVEVLERIGTPEARAVLENLVGGAGDAELTRDAKASVRRLDQR